VQMLGQTRSVRVHRLKNQKADFKADTCANLNSTSLDSLNHFWAKTRGWAVTEKPYNYEYNADCAYANGFPIVAPGLDVKNGSARDRTGDLLRVNQT
jgi:hypothetical protein